MKVHATALPGLLLIEPAVHADARGFFVQRFHAREFAAATGVAPTFVQDNQSRSVPGVLRGLHYQLGQPQGKLVRVTRGAVYDVAVDLRRASPTFGRWLGHELGGDSPLQLWVPPGFAHGFLVLGTEPADVLYGTTDYYAPAQERCIRWDDPDLAIDWPLARAAAGAPLLSERDRAGLPLAAAPVFDDLRP